MGLSWDITKCADPDMLQSDKQWPVTNTLIWYTMFTDIGWTITEKNAPEFYARIHLIEKLEGPMMSTVIHDPDRGDTFEPHFITPADVQSVIGLSINVGEQTRLQFSKRIVKRVMDKSVAEYNEATKPE
jgi:hypothetical protein